MHGPINISIHSYSAEVEYLNLFIAMGPFESLLIPTGPFSEKCITNITYKKGIY